MCHAIFWLAYSIAILINVNSEAIRGGCKVQEETQEEPSPIAPTIPIEPELPPMTEGPEEPWNPPPPPPPPFSTDEFIPITLPPAPAETGAPDTSLGLGMHIHNY